VKHTVGIAEGQVPHAPMVNMTKEGSQCVRGGKMKSESDDGGKWKLR
jgi:hypothetical protein